MHENSVSLETEAMREKRDGCWERKKEFCDNKAWTIRNLNLFISKTENDNKDKVDMERDNMEIYIYIWNTWRVVFF